MRVAGRCTAVRETGRRLRRLRAAREAQERIDPAGEVERKYRGDEKHAGGHWVDGGHQAQRSDDYRADRGDCRAARERPGSEALQPWRTRVETEQSDQAK